MGRSILDRLYMKVTEEVYSSILTIVMVVGHRHSEESKQKMSKANIGKTPPNKGIPMSDEQKNKIREAKKHITEETRKKMSESRKGKHRVYTPDGHFHFE